MGVLIYPERARRSRCECYLVGEDPSRPEDRICFARGIIGTLSDAQERVFCPPGKTAVRTPSPRMRERLRRFRILGQLLDACLEQDEADFGACLRRELERLPGG